MGGGGPGVGPASRVPRLVLPGQPFQAGDEPIRRHQPDGGHRVGEGGARQVERVPGAEDVVERRVVVGEAVLVGCREAVAGLRYQAGDRVLGGAQPFGVRVRGELSGGAVERQMGDLDGVAVGPYGGRRAGGVRVPLAVPAAGDDVGGLLGAAEPGGPGEHGTATEGRPG